MMLAMGTIINPVTNFFRRWGNYLSSWPEELL
jgi:hypothetical protein